MLGMPLDKLTLREKREEPLRIQIEEKSWFICTIDTTLNRHWHEIALSQFLLSDSIFTDQFLK